MPFRWALLDIETSGINFIHDKITAITVMILTDNGMERVWYGKVKQQFFEEENSALLTSQISPDFLLVSNFADLVPRLLELLDACKLIALNGRWVYSFLKNEFKVLDKPFCEPILCLTKLISKLHPQIDQFDLPFLAEFFKVSLLHNGQTPEKIFILQGIIEKLIVTHGLNSFQKTAKSCLKEVSIPSKLKTDLRLIPNSPGVYLFYGRNTTIPIYIGKSITLQKRIKSHFQTDHSNLKEFRLSQQVDRIEYIATAGELSALLLESALVKKYMPIYNRKLRRKKRIVSYKLIDTNGYLKVEIICESNFENVQSLYGSFRSITAAKKSLWERVRKYDLCAKLCDLESAGNSCFAFQLKRCKGACVGAEDVIVYNQRLLSALADLKGVTWPYKGMIAIKEYCPHNKLTEYMIFYQWRYLGAVRDVNDLARCEKQIKCHDADEYKILLSYLNNHSGNKEIIEFSE